MSKAESTENSPAPAPAPAPAVAGSAPPEAVPFAVVEPVRPIAAASYMWILAVICLLLAIGMVWWSLPGSGHKITVHFPDGHGLEADDAVRYRGIDVGTVRRVELNPELTGVDVTVELKPFAGTMACEGTRFWIVRPELSLTGITGIETAVGHKYIGLIPGDPAGPRQTAFEGLALSPPDALPESGIEILLRGEFKHSVNRDSPVTCRGVEIGRVLSVGLSQDARYVDARARIFRRYIHLITDKTVFWATSGVDVQFSISTGLSLSAESLETIARGGVSLLTVEGGGKAIEPGHVFVLHAGPEKDWIEQARNVRSNDIELFGSLPLTANWKRKSLLGTGSRTQAFNGMPYRSGTGATMVLIPRDMTVEPENAVVETFRIAVTGKVESGVDPTAVAEPFANEQLVGLKVPDKFSASWVIPKSQIRTAGELEDCLAVRGTWQTEDKLTFVHYPVEKQEMGDDWMIRSFHGDREIWHGASVLSERDGKLIGILLVEKNQAQIIRLDPSQFE